MNLEEVAQQIIQQAIAAGADEAAIATQDGLLVAEQFRPSSFAESICAMAAASMAAAESTIECQSVRRLDHLWIEGTVRCALLKPLDDRLLLVAFLSPEARDTVLELARQTSTGLVAAG